MMPFVNTAVFQKSKVPHIMQTSDIMQGQFDPFITFNHPTNQQFDKCKKETYKFHEITKNHTHTLHESTKSHTHMAYSYQEMMCTSVQAIQTPLCPFHTFWPKKSKFLKNEQMPGDIIILHQCTKNHNHMIFNLQNMMQIALQVILGHLCLLPNF